MSHLKALQHLSQHASFKALIERVGPCELKVRPQQEPYESLMRAVAYQQITGKAGDKILERFLALNQGHFPTPDKLLTLDESLIRQCGFSMRKIHTLQAVARGVLEGVVTTYQEAQALENAELISKLTTLPGIGQWTVEMFLMFNLGREDVLPVGDYGVRNGYRWLIKSDVLPTPKALAVAGAPWAPYRSVASWYLWRASALPDLPKLKK